MMVILALPFTIQYKVGQTRRPRMWKFPGGLSNEQENFGELFRREKYNIIFKVEFLRQLKRNKAADIFGLEITFLFTHF